MATSQNCCEGLYNRVHPCTLVLALLSALVSLLFVPVHATPQIPHTAPYYPLLFLPRSAAIASLHLSCDYFRGFSMAVRLASRGEFQSTDDHDDESWQTQPRDAVLTLERTLPPGEHYFFVSVFDGNASFLAHGSTTSRGRSKDTVSLHSTAPASLNTPRPRGSSTSPRNTTPLARGPINRRASRLVEQIEAARRLDNQTAKVEEAPDKASSIPSLPINTGPFWIVKEIPSFHRVPWKAACTSQRIAVQIRENLQAC